VASLTKRQLIDIMGQLDFFKKIKKTDTETVILKKPSLNHIAFADKALEIFSPEMEKFGFIGHRTEIDTNLTTIVFRKDKQYIKIDGSTEPRDLNDCYNIILGEGDSEDFWEWDWNSIALWRLKRTINPKAKTQEYSFPFGDEISDNLISAKKELLKFGQTFLNGDLTLFYNTRQEQNRDREPYKIHSPDNYGKYQTIDEPRSTEMKKKYS
jgi:hypothetical protein